MKNPILRTLIAGLAGSLTMNVAMLLTFRLAGFAWNGGGILLNPSVQSQKLIAVWTQIEPLPLVVSNPAPIVFGLMLFSIGHALIYRWLSSAWLSGVTTRTVRLGMSLHRAGFSRGSGDLTLHSLGGVVQHRCVRQAHAQSRRSNLGLLNLGS